MDDRVRDFREVIRDEMIMRDRVLAVLQEGPRTVPEIAESMGSPAHEVMYWVMAARKYGLVAEVKDPDDNYFQYELVEKK